jgi:hypothetical protein
MSRLRHSEGCSQSVAAALESGANKVPEELSTGGPFESRIGAAPVCAKSTRKVTRVVCWVCGGVSDEWKW